VTPARLVAAAAAIATALLLQATVIGPAAGAVPISLPAVLVAAIALVNGPATGIAFGFACGLVADLGSTHPAGVLALCWLGIGLAAGTFAERHSTMRDAAAVAVICTLAGAATSLVLTVMHDGPGARAAVTAAPACALGDLAIALVLVPLVRRMLRTDRLRPPRPVARELLTADRRG
jgi:cell shape-determining protein MreD